MTTVKAPKARHLVAKAVDQFWGIGVEARRAGTHLRGELRFSAAPSALNDFYFGPATASRPWLLNDGPADLTPRPLPRA